MRKAYQTDLSDAEWSYLESHLPAPKANGRPRIYPLREILDAIFYIVRSGCAWRLFPHDFATVEDRLPLLPLLALGRYLGEDALCPAQAGAGRVSRGTLSPAQR